jgi:uncharacterized membrane protein YdjX (TVP38/TMEM64 family)
LEQRAKKGFAWAIIAIIIGVGLAFLALRYLGWMP